MEGAGMRMRVVQVIKWIYWAKSRIPCTNIIIVISVLAMTPLSSNLNYTPSHIVAKFHPKPALFSEQIPKNKQTYSSIPSYRPHQYSRIASKHHHPPPPHISYPRSLDRREPLSPFLLTNPKNPHELFPKNNHSTQKNFHLPTSPLSSTAIHLPINSYYPTPFTSPQTATAMHPTQ